MGAVGDLEWKWIGEGFHARPTRAYLIGGRWDLDWKWIGGWRSDVPNGGGTSCDANEGTLEWGLMGLEREIRNGLDVGEPPYPEILWAMLTGAYKHGVGFFG